MPELQTIVGNKFIKNIHDLRASIIINWPNPNINLPGLCASLGSSRTCAVMFGVPYKPLGMPDPIH
jgi:hypothetical protein